MVPTDVLVQDPCLFGLPTKLTVAHVATCTSVYEVLSINSVLIHARERGPGPQRPEKSG